MVRKVDLITQRKADVDETSVVVGCVAGDRRTSGPCSLWSRVNNSLFLEDLWDFTPNL